MVVFHGARDNATAQAMRVREEWGGGYDGFKEGGREGGREGVRKRGREEGNGA